MNRKTKNTSFKNTVLLFGILLAILIAFLKYMEYRIFVRELAFEIYVGVVAAICMGLGVWVGLKLLNKKPINARDSEVGQDAIKALSLTARELEVLELISHGHSNQEIADRLFISLPTVKTHSSNLFSKLDVRRRTQAIQLAKELNIIQ